MRGRGPFFFLPPATTPEQQNPAPDVVSVLREHIAFTAAARAETRLVRRQQMETLMKIAELSAKVDALISVASTIKAAADNGASHQTPEDDPEVEQLAKRIDDAISVLQGNVGLAGPVGTGTSPSNTVDPNAPVT